MATDDKNVAIISRGSVKVTFKAHNLKLDVRFVPAQGHVNKTSTWCVWVMLICLKISVSSVKVSTEISKISGDSSSLSGPTTTEIIKNYIV